MCIPEATDNAKTLAAQFALLSGVQDELQQDGLKLDTVSMGMSSDMAQAIAAGSTMVRVGTAILVPATIRNDSARGRSACPGKTIEKQEEEQAMQITFIGGGNMATAIIGGLHQQGGHRITWWTLTPPSWPNWAELWRDNLQACCPNNSLPMTSCCWRSSRSSSRKFARHWLRA
jgi:hypothetical protein